MPRFLIAALASAALLLLQPAHCVRPSANSVISITPKHAGDAVEAQATPQAAATPAQRLVHISGQNFVVAATGAPVVLAGPNVVVKGPPYLPSVAGDTVCTDVVNDDCKKHLNCTTCTTFNQADVDHIKSLGWNTIRLSVTWQGAQPRQEDKLDPDFLHRLHAILNLTDANGLYVLLDNHGDMVGSAACGNGVPMWFSKLAAPDLIGQPLETDFPYSVFAPTVEKIGGYAHCGTDPYKWAAYAGDANYNMLNECCVALNHGGNPPGLGFTSLAQATMQYVVGEGLGRSTFVRYWELLARELVQHPSAVAIEPMNEPMSVWRGDMFDTWRAVGERVNGIIPDMSVAFADIMEGAIWPSWVTRLGLGGLDISSTTLDYLKASKTAFFAWHWYGNPSDPDEAIANVQSIMRDWGVPSFATEFMSCDLWTKLEAAKISHSYWHYSDYCNTDPTIFGKKTFPTETFGACILGWASGNNHRCTPSQREWRP